MGRLNKRDRAGAGGGEVAFQYVRGNYLKGDGCDGCSKETPLNITRLVNVYYSRRFDVTCSMQPSS